MKIIIVEDEKLAAERLKTLLFDYDPLLTVCACMESIEETVQYLKQHPTPDLMILDIHLSDGHSFEIFNQVNFSGPVIFTTAYDQYALQAFKMLSIDYILKPVTQEALASAINKLKMFSSGFTSLEFNKLSTDLTENQYKKRFIGKVGQRLFYINAADIFLFEASNKIVHIIDQSNNRYLAEHNIEKIEQLVDPRKFFRLNRGNIVNISAVKQVKPYFNGRLKLTLKFDAGAEEIIISRDRVGKFKEWAAG